MDFFRVGFSLNSAFVFLQKVNILNITFILPSNVTTHVYFKDKIGFASIYFTWKN